MSTNREDPVLAFDKDHPLRKNRVRKKLLDYARGASSRAYTYSNKPTGAAIMTRDRKVYVGANVETARREASICGERNAILESVTHGAMFEKGRIIDAVALSCFNAAESNSIRQRKPCGQCLQFMAHFCMPDTLVIMDDGGEGTYASYRELFPKAYYSGDKTHIHRPQIKRVDPKQIERIAAEQDDLISLLVAAERISHHAFTPRSGRLSGAAIRCTDGSVFVAPRIETSPKGLSINPERAVINRAAQKIAKSHGPHFIKQMAVYHDDLKPHTKEDLLRLANTELLAEFATPDAELVLSSGGHTGFLRLADLYAAIRTVPVAGSRPRPGSKSPGVS